MKITQKIMQQTYEDTIDKHIERIKHIRANGLTEDTDILLLDTCLKYIILMSESRSEEQ